MKSFLSASLLTALASAAVINKESSSGKSSCTKKLDNFDDLTANTVLPLLSPVGTHGGLEYQGWVVASPLAGNIPQSKPNVAVATLQTDEVQLGSLTLTPFGSLVAASPVKYFDLSSFYYGCVIDTHTAAAVVNEGCTITVTGFYNNGAQAPAQTYSFAPTNPLLNGMDLATLPETYKGLVNVTFGVADAAVLAAATVLDVDDVAHCDYS